MDDPMFFSLHTLASGMQLYYQYRPHLSWVGCEIVVWAGSRHSPEGKEELAHLVEHLIGIETEGYPKLNMTQLVKWQESMHWYMNLGTTEVDYSTYGGSAPIDRVEGMLTYLNAYIRKPKLDDGFEHELAIMKNERTDQGWSEQQMAAMRLRYAELYRDPHLVSWLTDASDLDLLTMDDARAFHRQYYDCPNMTMVMVGGLPPNEAVSLVERTFPPGGTTMRRTPRQEARPLHVPRRRTAANRKKGGRRRRANRPRSVTLTWMWIVPPGSEDAVRLAVDCLEQLLEERIREKWTLNYGASTEFGYHVDHRRLEIATTVHPEYEQRVRKLFIDTLRDADAVVAEMAERKTAFRRMHEIYDPDVETTIENAVYDLVALDRIQTVAESVNSYEAVTEDEVRQALAQILRPERYFLDIEET